VQSTETNYSFEKLIECPFPAIAMLVSGGHTEIVLVKEIGGYEVLGQTRDDAIGEAFDKVARMLGLPYPGGPEISRLAETERSKEKELVPGVEGHNEGHMKIIFPRPMIDADTLDMSFSGLKTAVLYELRKHETIDAPLQEEVAREFEDAVTDVLISKLERAFDAHEARALIAGGGVMANKHILAACTYFADRRGVAFLPPARGLSGDNALMIAIAGTFHTEKIEVEKMRAQGNLSL
jgi:N6-L-threonylcarbamoyladenine synthase